MLNIVLFGPPGAGKGTQSKKIIEKYRLLHLSTGDLLHSEAMAGTPLGQQARKLMSEGKLVPDEVVINMINNKFKANSECRGFVFDGFPRTFKQAEALHLILEENDLSISKVIALEVDEEEVVKRILQRGKEKGRFYDQKENIIRSRLKTYYRETAPIAEYYKQQNLFITINGTGEIEDIFQKVAQVLDPLLKND